jgi:DNA-binding transcriptional LysR family regulator
MDETMRKLLTVWNWLPATHLVAELGTVRAAAQALKVSPSAVSRMVTLTEQTIQCAILERGPNRVIVTQAGTDFSIHTGQALSTLREVLLRHAADFRR